MTTISRIQALPTSPYEGTGVVPIVITSGIVSYFKVTGTQLSGIVDVNWYPVNVNSVKFMVRQMVSVDETIGTFMIQVIDNYLDISDRAGKLSFRLVDGNTITFPVVTYGPVTATPIWRNPQEGLITG